MSAHSWCENVSVANLLSVTGEASHLTRDENKEAVPFTPFWDRQSL